VTTQDLRGKVDSGIRKLYVTLWIIIRKSSQNNKKFDPKTKGKRIRKELA